MDIVSTHIFVQTDDRVINKLTLSKWNVHCLMRDKMTKPWDFFAIFYYTDNLLLDTFYLVYFYVNHWNWLLLSIKHILFVCKRTWNGFMAYPEFNKMVAHSFVIIVCFKLFIVWSFSRDHICFSSHFSSIVKIKLQFDTPVIFHDIMW